MNVSNSLKNFLNNPKMIVVTLVATLTLTGGLVASQKIVNSKSATSPLSKEQFAIASPQISPNEESLTSKSNTVLGEKTQTNLINTQKSSPTPSSMTQQPTNTGQQSSSNSNIGSTPAQFNSAVNTTASSSVVSPVLSPSPTLSPSPSAINGITSLSFKTYWSSGVDMSYDYSITICIPDPPVVWVHMYIIGPDGSQASPSTIDFHNKPCDKMSVIGGSLKTLGFSQLGQYTLKAVVDSPAQSQSVTSTIGPP